MLRRWQDSDAEALFKYASDPDLGPMAGWAPHKSVEESLETIRTIFSGDTMWAVVLMESDEPIGCVGYLTSNVSNMTIGEDECEVGYWIAKPYWNQGICTEALSLVIEHCANEKGYTSLWGTHFIDNPASGRVMEKCGFIEAGSLSKLEKLEVGSDKPVRVMKLDVKSAALELALRVFMDFEAPEYPEAGVEEFKRALSDPDYVGKLRFYVKLNMGRTVGMLATRCNGSHLALFFVDKHFHRQGIGRELFTKALSNCPAAVMTVFSSPYAVEIYKKLGLHATDVEQIDNGIRYTPMETTNTH